MEGSGRKGKRAEREEGGEGGAEGPFTAPRFTPLMIRQFCMSVRLYTLNTLAVLK